MKTTSFMPYIMKSFVDWMIDNNFVPRIKVSVNQECLLPMHIMEDYVVFLDLHFKAIRNLSYEKDGIGFDTRFNTIKHYVFIPYKNIDELIVVSLEQQNLLSISLDDFQELDLANISTDIIDNNTDYDSSKETELSVSENNFDKDNRKYKKFGNFVLIDCQKD